MGLSLINPLSDCLSYLPKTLVKKIKPLDRIAFKNIGDLVSNLSEDAEENKSLVKRALKRQEEIVDELKREIEEKKDQTQPEASDNDVGSHNQFLKDEEFLDCLLFRAQDSSNFLS